MPGRKAPEVARREQILNAAYRVAIRQRLGGLGIRDVAREAGLSSGLVLFHFKTKDALIAGLLEWLLENTSVLRPDTQSRDARSAGATLCGLVRAEAQRLSADRLRSELFFDFWVAGTRTTRIRAQMRRALAKYRQEFRTLAGTWLAASGARCNRATADGVAAAAVSFVHGCAIQAVIDPAGFDLKAALSVLDALAEQLRAGETHHELRPARGPRTRQSSERRRAGKTSAPVDD
jgi:TetR/AcrR family transcriptional regulator, transcriptional repressor of bet genes